MTRTSRFWSKVRIDDGCWEWIGARSTRGYGMLVTIEGATRRYEGAHRVSWEIANGPIPDGLFICHHCDNKLCVRPNHLFLGTAADNNADRDRKGRYVRPHIGEDVPGVRLTSDDVRTIRRDRANGVKLADLAERYGVRKQTISAATRGDNWKHIE